VEKRARLVAPTLENVAVREGNLIVG
jgi:hypothetical protein